MIQPREGIESLFEKELVADDHPVLHSFISSELADEWLERNGYAPHFTRDTGETVEAVCALAFEWYSRRGEHPIVVNITPPESFAFFAVRIEPAA